MLPSSVMGEVYCFLLHQLIFSFICFYFPCFNFEDFNIYRRVIYHSKGLWEYIPQSIPSVCTTISKRIAGLRFYPNYASPSSGEAYRDRRLTTNFEFWVEIFCVPTCFHMRIPKPCLSICPYLEKRNHHNFVNISPTLVINTWMERSSRVLHHGNPKIWKFYFKKVRNSNCDFWRRAEITFLRWCGIFFGIFLMVPFFWDGVVQPQLLCFALALGEGVPGLLGLVRLGVHFWSPPP